MDDASATDNCGEVTIAVVETTTPGACAGDYSITREFTATDDCGNATSSTQTITIIDTTAPVLTIPADYTAECSDAHPMDDASATDNCGEVTIDVVETTTAWRLCAGDYTITREFTATDDCGNATSATQTITIIDTTSPVLTMSQLTTLQSAQTLILWMHASATDNCGEVTIDCSRDYYSWRLCRRLHDHQRVYSYGRLRKRNFGYSDYNDYRYYFTSTSLSYLLTTLQSAQTHILWMTASATDNCGEVTIDCSRDYYSWRLCRRLHDHQRVYSYGRLRKRNFCYSDYYYYRYYGHLYLLSQLTTLQSAQTHILWMTASATDNCGEVTIDVVETTIAWRLCRRLHYHQRVYSYGRLWKRNFGYSDYYYYRYYFTCTYYPIGLHRRVLRRSSYG